MLAVVVMAGFMRSSEVGVESAIAHEGVLGRQVVLEIASALSGCGQAGWPFKLATDFCNSVSAFLMSLSSVEMVFGLRARAGGRRCCLCSWSPLKSL